MVYSKALVNKGHQVTILLPKYDSLNLDLVDQLKVF